MEEKSGLCLVISFLQVASTVLKPVTESCEVLVCAVQVRGRQCSLARWACCSAPAQGSGVCCARGAASARPGGGIVPADGQPHGLNPETGWDLSLQAYSMAAAK